ncbi:PucR family transcriptional regulator [Pseudalkalibacillus hwajinpoensis]|uniref:PucR family transcriptional regulator n=1 Tax=Guptibacillus hwajinpoensis TaxID=208199 RepID=UPI001CFD61EA|nr:PucR family transcriptional regulator [Pseudalkalibacillus hwajinpoensis]
MGLSVREALQLSEMSEIKLIAGKQGIDRDIKWLTIVEVMEDVTRLHEGEFLITTAYGWQEKSESYTRLIQALSNRQLSAVAIHTGFYLDVVPLAMIEAANRTGLPLLEIPRTMNFSTVTRSILEQLVNKQLSMLTQAQRIQDELTALVIKNTGFSSLTDALSKLLNCNVSIYQSNGDLLAGSYVTNRHFSFEHAYPIVTEGKTIGTIFIQKQTPLTSLDQLSLKQAANIFAIEFLKLRIIEDTRAQIEADFLDVLFSHSYEDEKYILKKSKEMGYDFTGLNSVAVLSSSNLSELEQQCHETLISTRTKGLIKRKIDHVVVLLADHFEVFLTEHQSSFSTMGVSTATGIQELETALKEALIAHQFARYRKASCIPFESLGAYQVFIRLKENGEDLTTYYQSLLSPIVAYDQKHQSQLMRTLEAFLENNLVINRTADKLFIHRHTLNYRIKQLEKLTGIDIYSYDQRIHVQFALLAYLTDCILSSN